MKAPKKRKIPKAKRSQHLKRSSQIISDVSNMPIMKHANNIIPNILAEWHYLEMDYSFEQCHKVLDKFYADYQLEDRKTTFLPESITCKAYNYSELFIALKMQQVTCRDWKIKVTGSFYNKVTTKFADIDYEIELNDLSFCELFMGMPIKIDRGLGIKSRWKGLEAEIQSYFEEKGYSAKKNWYRGNTQANIIGKCKFVSIDMFDEFMHLREFIDNDEIEEFFEMADKDSLEKGRVDEKMQPIDSSLLSIPCDLIKRFKQSRTAKKRNFAPQAA